MPHPPLLHRHGKTRKDAAALSRVAEQSIQFEDGVPGRNPTRSMFRRTTQYWQDIQRLEDGQHLGG